MAKVGFYYRFLAILLRFFFLEHRLSNRSVITDLYTIIIFSLLTGRNTSIPSLMWIMIGSYIWHTLSWQYYFLRRELYNARLAPLTLHFRCVFIFLVSHWIAVDAVTHIRVNGVRGLLERERGEGEVTRMKGGRGQAGGRVIITSLSLRRL